jgi:hypothetical protein
VQKCTRDDPAAIRAAGDKQEPKRFASCDKARLKTPWQDRQTLFASRISPVMCNSFSPSCSWLSGTAENQ